MRILSSYCFISSIIVLFLLLGMSGPVYSAKNGCKSFTFFSQTQFPLKVYYIQGQEPGPTVMVQGGIQGDEPSGYLTAQILASSKLKKGNLIVVPRANYPAIIEGERTINVDLNRRFDQEYTQFYEDYLARVIKFLVKNSDALIHLHEGSGFYCPRYVNRLQNPNRYGQSVIIDTAVFEDRINLAKTVNNVLPCLNEKIFTNKYRFQLFNTETFSSKTQYPEQKRSLTYYTLQRCRIPALAIEVSKDIKNLAWKVEQQLRATTFFLYRFGLRLDLPDFSKMVLKEYFQRIKKDQTYNNLLEYRSHNGSDISCLDTKGCFSSKVRFQEDLKGFNPSVGAYTDDWPQLNILRLPCSQLPHFSEKISLKSDGQIVSHMELGNRSQAEIHNFFSQPIFVCLLNNKMHFISAGEELVAREGDRLVMLGMWQRGSQEVINLKGYVSQAGYNDGQDMGREIILSKDFFISKYLMDADNPSHWRCRAIRETSGETNSEFTVLVLPQKIQGLELSSKQGHRFQFPIGTENVFHIPPGEYKLTDIYGPSHGEMYLPIINGMPMKNGESFFLGQDAREQLSIYLTNSFKLITRLYLVGNKVN